MGDDLNKMFPDLSFCACCGSGWNKILIPILECISKHNKNNPDSLIYIDDIKEKFGSLRVYISGDISEELDEMVAAAENKSALTCETCGEPGNTHSIRGWLSTYCLTHLEERLKKIKN